MTLWISDEDVQHLLAAVEDVTGEPSELFCHPFEGMTVLAYVGSHPEIVAFELAVILAERVERQAHRGGYDYGAVDMVDEIRHLICHIDSAATTAREREIQFYWPAVVVGIPPARGFGGFTQNVNMTFHGCSPRTPR